MSWFDGSYYPKAGVAIALKETPNRWAGSEEEAGFGQEIFLSPFYLVLHSLLWMIQPKLKKKKKHYSDFVFGSSLQLWITCEPYLDISLVSLGGKKPAVEFSCPHRRPLNINEAITSILIFFLAICKVIPIRINVSSEQVRLKHN